MFKVVDGELKEVARSNATVMVLPSGIHTISTDAFIHYKHSSTLKRLIVSEGVTTIREHALSSMFNLEVLELPSSIRVIEQGALSNNKNLTILKCKAKDIEFSGDPFVFGNDKSYWLPKNDPRNLISVGDTLFSYYGSDRLVALPRGIRCIWSGAFKNNKKVTQIVLSSTVRQIMPGAFDNCPNLKEVLIDSASGLDSTGLEFVSCPRVNSLTESSKLGEIAMYTDITQSLNMLLKRMGDIKEKTFFPNALRETSFRASNELELVVKCKGIPEVCSIVEHYGYIEQKARALLIAGRYHNPEFTRELLKRGFSFNYREDYSLLPDYTQIRRGGYNAYETQFYLGIIPRVVHFKDRETILSRAFHYDRNTINIENTAISLEHRISVIDAYLEAPLKYGVSADLMLWFAISRGELEIAEHLINKGIDLNSEVPYCCPDIEENRTIIEILTEDNFAGYYKQFIEELSRLKWDKLLGALRILNELASRIGKKICLNQSAFNQLNYREMPVDVFEYIVAEFKLINMTKKKTLETLINDSTIEKFKILVNNGWISSIAVRDSLIETAREKQQLEMTAWLIDYKNRTADEAYEEAKAAERFMRELTADPYDPFIIRKNWVYRKKSDGTIKITNYRGSEINVVVPHKVGDDIVTEIGAKCFSPHNTKASNFEKRKLIKSIIFPDSVEIIGNKACFECRCLERVILPSRLIELGESAFGYCGRLANVVLPDSLKCIPHAAFIRCQLLNDVVLPKNVKSIGDSAFLGCSINSFTIPSTVESLGYGIFNYNTDLQSVEILCDCTCVYSLSFMYCTALTDIYVGNNTDLVFGYYYHGFGFGSDVTIHTNETSRTSRLFKSHPADNINLAYDFYP